MACFYTCRYPEESEHKIIQRYHVYSPGCTAAKKCASHTFTLAGLVLVTLVNLESELDQVWRVHQGQTHGGWGSRTHTGTVGFGGTSRVASAPPPHPKPLKLVAKMLYPTIKNHFIDLDAFQKHIQQSTGSHNSWTCELKRSFLTGV